MPALKFGIVAGAFLKKIGAQGRRAMGKQYQRVALANPHPRQL